MRERLGMSMRGCLLLVLVLGLPGSLASAQGLATAGNHAALMGGWSLNRELSGPVLSPDVPGRAGGRRSGGGGGFGGGFGRGRGGGQDPRAPEDTRAEIQRRVDLLQELVTPATRWHIDRDEGDAIAFTNGDGRTARYVPNGKAEKHQLTNGTIETRSSWELGALRQELSAPGGVRLVRTFSIQPETDQLVVTLTFPDRGRGGAQRPSRAVYDRDAL